jgi:hypothetical protein
MYTGATSKDTAHSLIDGVEHFHLFKQSSCMDNATYLRTFQSHVEALTILTEDLVSTCHIKARIKNAGKDPDDVTV